MAPPVPVKDHQRTALRHPSRPVKRPAKGVRGSLPPLDGGKDPLTPRAKTLDGGEGPLTPLVRCVRQSSGPPAPPGRPLRPLRLVARSGPPRPAAGPPCPDVVKYFQGSNHYER